MGVIFDHEIDLSIFAHTANGGSEKRVHCRKYEKKCWAKKRWNRLHKLGEVGGSLLKISTLFASYESANNHWPQCDAVSWKCCLFSVSEDSSEEKKVCLKTWHSVVWWSAQLEWTQRDKSSFISRQKDCKWWKSQRAKKVGAQKGTVRRQGVIDMRTNVGRSVSVLGVGDNCEGKRKWVSKKAAAKRYGNLESESAYVERA